MLSYGFNDIDSSFYDHDRMSEHRDGMRDTFYPQPDDGSSSQQCPGFSSFGDPNDPSKFEDFLRGNMSRNENNFFSRSGDVYSLQRQHLQPQSETFMGTGMGGLNNLLAGQHQTSDFTHMHVQNAQTNLPPLPFPNVLPYQHSNYPISPPQTQPNFSKTFYDSAATHFQEDLQQGSRYHPDMMHANAIPPSYFADPIYLDQPTATAPELQSENSIPSHQQLHADPFSQAQMRNDFTSLVKSEKGTDSNFPFSFASLPPAQSGMLMKADPEDSTVSAFPLFNSISLPSPGPHHSDESLHSTEISSNSAEYLTTTEISVTPKRRGRGGRRRKNTAAGPHRRLRVHEYSTEQQERIRTLNRLAACRHRENTRLAFTTLLKRIRELDKENDVLRQEKAVLVVRAHLLLQQIRALPSTDLPLFS